MLNAVKSVLGDVSSISPLSERRANANEGLTLEASANTHSLQRSAYLH